jgi:hypothetical protein
VATPDAMTLHPNTIQYRVAQAAWLAPAVLRFDDQRPPVRSTQPSL